MGNQILSNAMMSVQKAVPDPKGQKFLKLATARKHAAFDKPLAFFLNLFGRVVRRDSLRLPELHDPSLNSMQNRSIAPKYITGLAGKLSFF